MSKYEKDPNSEGKEDKGREGFSEEKVFSDENRERIENLPSAEEVQDKYSQGEKEEAEKLEKKRKEYLSSILEDLDSSSSGETMKRLAKLGDEEVVKEGDPRIDEIKEGKEKEKEEKERREEEILKEIKEGKKKEKAAKNELGELEKDKKRLEKEIKAIQEGKEKREQLREEARERKEKFVELMNGEGLNREAAEKIYDEIYRRKVRKAEKERKISDSTFVREGKAEVDEAGVFQVSSEEIKKEMNLDLNRKDLRENPTKGKQVRVEKEPGKLEEGWEIIEDIGDGKVRVGKIDHGKPEDSDSRHKEKKEVDIESLVEWTFPKDESEVEIIPDNKREETEKIKKQTEKRLEKEGEMLEEGAEYGEHRGREMFKVTSEQHKEAEKEMKKDLMSRTIPGRVAKATGGIMKAIGKGLWGFLKTLPHLAVFGFSSILEKIAKKTGEDKDKK